MLGFPREEGEWYLDTDASEVGSPFPDAGQPGYCTVCKELLAVVRALKYFKCYLYDPVGQPEEEGEGDADGFTSIRALVSDTESGSETKGCEAWRGARKAEAEVWQKEPVMSCPRG